MKVKGRLSGTDFSIIVGVVAKSGSLCQIRLDGLIQKSEYEFLLAHIVLRALRVNPGADFGANITDKQLFIHRCFSYRWGNCAINSRNASRDSQTCQFIMPVGGGLRQIIHQGLG